MSPPPDELCRSQRECGRGGQGSPTEPIQEDRRSSQSQTGSFEQPGRAALPEHLDRREEIEGAMRPVALGRKNWLHIGSESADPKVAHNYLDRGNLPSAGHQPEKLPGGRSSQAWAMARHPGGRTDTRSVESY